MFSDLECDYINPIDLCNKLNQVRDGSAGGAAHVSKESLADTHSLPKVHSP